MRFSVPLIAVLSSAALAVARNSQVSQCYSILQKEQAYCKSFLHGELPPQSTVTTTQTVTVTPAAVLVTDTATATTTVETTETDEVDTTLTKYYKTRVTSTSTETDTETYTITTYTTITTTNTIYPTGTTAIAQRHLPAERAEQDKRSGSNLQKKLAKFSSSIITEACYEILYGATTRSATTETVSTTATAATPTTATTVTTTTTQSTTETDYSTSTITTSSTRTATVTKTVDTTTTTTTTDTIVLATETVTVYSGCPDDCYIDTDVNGDVYCDSYDFPTPHTYCSSDSDCTDGFCVVETANYATSVPAIEEFPTGICAPNSDLCVVTNSKRDLLVVEQNRAMTPRRQGKMPPQARANSPLPSRRRRA